MGLPERIRVGPLTYAVQETMPALGDETYLGESLHTEGIIRLRADLPTEHKELVFIHEVLHALMYVVGLPGGGEEAVSVKAEELTNRLSFALYQFLRDNGFWPKEEG